MRLRNKIGEIFQTHIQLLRQYRIHKRMMVSMLLITTLPLCVVAIYSFLGSYNDVKEKIGFYSVQMTQQAAGNMSLMLDNIENISERIAESEIVQNEFKRGAFLPELERYKVDDNVVDLLTSNFTSSVKLDGVTIMSKEGFYRIYVGNRMVPTNYMDSVLYQTIVSHDKSAFWLAPYTREVASYSAFTAQKLVVFCESIKDKWSGNSIGVLGLSIDPHTLVTAMAESEIWEKGTVSVIDTSGVFIYNDDDALIGTKLDDERFLGKIINANAETEQPYFDYKMDNQKMLIACDKLKNADWYVVSAIPYSELMRRTNNILAFTIIVIILCVSICIYISLVLAQSIEQPISKLMNAIAQAEKGILKIEVDTSGKDEMKYLSNSYKKAFDENNRLINELYMSQIAQQETQIKALKAQINPHFLYNTLETISSIAKIKGVREISTMAQKLSAMFRYSIKSGSEVVCLKDEITNITNYFYIMKTRFSGKLDYEIIVEEELYEYRMYKLILQPIVENAVRHGIEPKKGHGVITVKAEKQNDQISITISDNGVGMDEETLRMIRLKMDERKIHFDEKDVVGGIGIVNVNTRLAIYYQERYSLSVNSALNQGTSVTLMIPAEQPKEREK